MSAARYDRLREIFMAARELRGAQRVAMLDEACADDVELRSEIESLLADERQSTAFLESPALHGAVRQWPLAASLGSSNLASGSSPPAKLPARIGPFDIVGVLGEGGMGIVYEAEQALDMRGLASQEASAADAHAARGPTRQGHDHPRRRVALKVIRPGYAAASVVRRFEHEAQVLGLLHHPGIAQIYEVGVHEDRAGILGPAGTRVPYFAMELVRGKPLTVYAQAHELGSRQRLALLANVCDAVQHAHHRGVIHRDLKPANILVEAGLLDAEDASRNPSEIGNRKSAIPKILDFGVARVTDADVQMTTLQTDVGQLIGTLPYMSPEQCSGDPRAIDVRSDVYSLGVIGYELLTGHLPYQVRSRSIPELVRIIREDEPRRLSTIDRKLRGDVERIFLKALEKEPGRRYQSAGELAVDIRRVLADEPIIARAPSTAYRLRKFAQRNRVLVLGVVATFLALVAGLALTARQAFRARRAEAKATERFEDVRKLANAVIFEIHDAIRDLPGSTQTLKLLVERAIEYLDRLAADAGDNPALQAELAAAYERLARTQGSQMTRNLGDPVGGRRTYEKALPLREALLAQSPNDPSRILDLAWLRGEIGSTMFMHDPDQALVHYEAACELSRPICTRSIFARKTLAWFALRSAWCLSRGGSVDRAGQIALDTAQFLESLPELAAQTAAEMHDLAEAYHCTGSALVKGRHARAALPYFSRAAALGQTLSELEPRKWEYAIRTPDALRYQAQAEHTLGDYGAAIRTGELSLAGLESVLARFPDSFPTFQVRALVRLELADSYSQLGQLDPALEHGREGLAILEQVCADEPGVVFHRYNAMQERQSFAQILECFASDDATLPQEQLALWLEARDCYLAALDDLAALDEPTRRRGDADGSHAALEAGLARCEAMIASWPHDAQH